jgi:hypothetical protein
MWSGFPGHVLASAYDSHQELTFRVWLNFGDTSSSADYYENLHPLQGGFLVSLHSSAIPESPKLSQIYSVGNFLIII